MFGDHGYGRGWACGCGRSWGFGPAWGRWPSQQERIEALEEYQRDLEERAADVADEIKRLKDRPQV